MLKSGRAEADTIVEHAPATTRSGIILKGAIQLAGGLLCYHRS